ncbi:MAG: hypothetical protein R3F59_30910 [Myxococcota bacterium]
MDPESELQIRWRTHGLTAQVHAASATLPRSHLFATLWPLVVLAGLFAYHQWLGRPPIVLVAPLLPAPLLMVWEFAQTVRTRRLVLDGDQLSLEGIGRWRLRGVERVEVVPHGLALCRRAGRRVIVPLILQSEPSRHWLAVQLQRAARQAPTGADPELQAQLGRVVHAAAERMG